MFDINYINTYVYFIIFNKEISIKFIQKIIELWMYKVKKQRWGLQWVYNVISYDGDVKTGEFYV